MSLASEPLASRAPFDGGEADTFTTTSDGRYRVVGLLGSGGMGSVFEVEHTRLKRSFALKLLRPELARDAKLFQRFERETQALAGLQSDYVVSIVDSGTLSDGRPYFVMERLQGEDLRRLLERLPELPVARAVNLAIDACLGLHAAHATGLVHRDLKPANLFVSSVDGGGERCKLLDFGVAKAADTEATQPGALVGTARYMAPEQVTPDGALGPRTDLFALAVILYRCLSGKHPFDADTLERVLYKILHSAPPALERAGVPNALEAVILRALSKSADERPDCALTFARELLPFANGVRDIGPMTPWSVELVSTAHWPESEPTRDVSPVAGAESEPAVEASPSTKRRPWPAILAAALSLFGVASLGAWYGRTTAAKAAATLPAVAAPKPAAVETPPAPATPSPDALESGRSAAVPLVPPPPARSSSPDQLRVRPARAAAKASTVSSAHPPGWFNPQNPYGD